MKAELSLLQQGIRVRHSVPIPVRPAKVKRDITKENILVLILVLDLALGLILDLSLDPVLVLVLVRLTPDVDQILVLLILIHILVLDLVLLQDLILILDLDLDLNPGLGRDLVLVLVHIHVHTLYHLRQLRLYLQRLPLLLHHLETPVPILVSILIHAFRFLFWVINCMYCLGVGHPKNTLEKSAPRLDWGQGLVAYEKSQKGDGSDSKHTPSISQIATTKAATETSGACKAIKPADTETQSQSSSLLLETASATTSSNSSQSEPANSAVTSNSVQISSPNLLPPKPESSSSISNCSLPSSAQQNNTNTDADSKQLFSQRSNYNNTSSDHAFFHDSKVPLEHAYHPQNLRQSFSGNPCHLSRAHYIYSPSVPPSTQFSPSPYPPTHRMNLPSDRMFPPSSTSPLTMATQYQQQIQSQKAKETMNQKRAEILAEIDHKDNEVMKAMKDLEHLKKEKEKLLKAIHEQSQSTHASPSLKRDVKKQRRNSISQNVKATLTTAQHLLLQSVSRRPLAELIFERNRELKMEAEEYLDPLFPFALEDLAGSEKFKNWSHLGVTTNSCPINTSVTVDLNRSNTDLPTTNSTLSASQLSLRGSNNIGLQASSANSPDISINSAVSQQSSDWQLQTAVVPSIQKYLYKEPRELSLYQENLKKFERLKPTLLKYLAKKRVEQSEKDKKLRAKYIKLLTKWRRKLQQIKQQQRQARLEEEIKRQIADRGTTFSIQFTFVILRVCVIALCTCKIRRIISLI